MACRTAVYCFIALFVLCTVGQAQNGPTGNRPGLSLRETFDVYVGAVRRGDLDALFSTVTDSARFVFLTAYGERINTRQGYYDFHRQWFADTAWEMPVELLEVHENKDQGYTVAVFHYRQQNPDGTTSCLDSYFTLIFRREHGMWKVVTDICTPISRYTTGADPDIRYDQQQSYLLETIKNRRTVRKFTATPVPDDHLTAILDAARYAPTAGNQQPWKFLVIRDRAKLDRLRDAALSWYLETYVVGKEPDAEKRQRIETGMRGVLANVLSAPVYVAVLVDSLAPYPDCINEDGALAAGTLMIAARSLGYGTGYFTSFFPEDRMRTFFAIPDRYKLICFTPIGIPERWPPMKDKKDLGEFIVNEQFGTE